ncbi:hypothetical protein [Arthrobacter sp. TMS1-12-1]
MTKNPFARTFSLRSAHPSFVPFLLMFTGLTAIIVGILAMHVWMGGHGSTSHHVATPTTATTATTASAVTAATTAADSAAAHAADSPAHTHHGRLDRMAVGTVTLVAAVHAAVVDVSLAAVPSATAAASADGGMLTGCGGDCADEVMLGICVLAMIVAGITGLLISAGRALLSTVVRRGPPALARVSRPAPAPSLTHLCISRT